MRERAAGDLAPDAGLCEACRHRRLIATRRRSRFILCERSVVEPAYPRYPRLPVLHCAGFERPDPGSA